MSEFIFGVLIGKLTKAQQRARRAAAKKHAATWIYAELPDGYRSWFSAPNYGAPFDRQLAAAVAAEIGESK